jgi:DNA topoisomerase-1
MISDPTALDGQGTGRGSRPVTTPPLDALALIKDAGLHHVGSDALSIRRQRCGKGWIYLGPEGRRIKDKTTLRRLARLAVPPAYRNVLYAADPSAHLQAVGRDAEGRLQYRYHPRWEAVREIRKARRLARLADTLPRIHRSLCRHLAAMEPSRHFAFAAVIDLVARTAIRPGGESYVRLHGTRGAATLLKSNVAIHGETITLTFRGKGGKSIIKEFTAQRLAKVIASLQQLPGRRLFQYRDESGNLRRVTAQDVNAFLREIAGIRISLKDFRTLLASASVFEMLSRTQPAVSERKRRRQVLEAVRSAAEDLANTPAICRKSYVHQAVIAAFEDGMLQRFSDALKGCRSPAQRARLLTQVISADANGQPRP